MVTPESLQSKFVNVIADFHTGISINDNREFEGVSISPQWELVGRKDKFSRLTARNSQLGIFIKSYAPFTEDYASRAFVALNVLARLPLSVPVLAPLAVVERTLIFRLGTNPQEVRYYDKRNAIGKLLPFGNTIQVPESDRAQIDAVVTHLGLETLGRADHITFVNVNGTMYMTDPFEDSYNSIYDFFHPR